MFLGFRAHYQPEVVPPCQILNRTLSWEAKTFVKKLPAYSTFEACNISDSHRVDTVLLDHQLMEKASMVQSHRAYKSDGALTIPDHSSMLKLNVTQKPTNPKLSFSPEPVSTSRNN
jgi:hypothetical protein